MSRIFDDIGNFKVYQEDIRKIVSSGLSANAPIIYSAIKQYNIMYKKSCEWSLNDLSKSFAVSKNTILNVLKGLVNKGFLKKNTIIIKNQKFVSYDVTELIDE